MGFVVAVVVQNGHVAAELADDAPCDGGLAAAGAAGDPDGQNVHGLTSVLFLLSA